MKLLIVAGGGGHFVAALAVIQQLPKDWQIQVIGRQFAFEGDTALSLEYQTCQRLGIPFATITTGRIQRKLSKQTLNSLFKIPGGLLEARRLLAAFKPDLVLSFGGYVSVPVVAAAALQRIPVVLHEQTHHAGLANKFAATFATKVCVSWPDSQNYFSKEKTILTGNPLRQEFLAAQSLKPPHPAHAMIKKVLQNLPKGSLAVSHKKTPVIYITGGSGGAHGINVLVEGCIERLLQKYRVIHQTGDAQEFKDYDRLKQFRETLAEPMRSRYELHKFIDTHKVADILNEADLVVARSGINTVSELLYLGKPTLFIPLPYGQHNEQQTNAAFVKSIGIAEVVDQLTIDAVFLLTRIETMMQNLSTYKQHAEKAQALVKKDAANLIIEAVKETYEQTTNKNK